MAVGGCFLWPGRWGGGGKSKREDRHYSTWLSQCTHTVVGTMYQALVFYEQLGGGVLTKEAVRIIIVEVHATTHNNGIGRRLLVQHCRCIINQTCGTSKMTVSSPADRDLHTFLVQGREKEERNQSGK